MPTISFFYGIIIRMFFRDTDQHHLPHIHAEYQGDIAVFSIETGEILAGTMQKSKIKLVDAWIEIHRDELIADWQLAANGQNVFKIKGLDA
jgi:desulfoferrodoxin (superoxide reductase-like protein)